MNQNKDGSVKPFVQRAPWKPSERNPALEKRLFGDRVTQGINFDNYSNIPINVAGENAPPPISDFSDALLHPGVKWNLEMAGYKKPTPIQRTSVPIVVAGRDLMACAQTGSGKTAAFLIPILSQLFYDGPSETTLSADGNDGNARWGIRPTAATPSALIMAPTRELAIQIKEEVDKFAYRSFVKCGCIYGGTSTSEQQNAISRGCDILVATPGRLIDFMERGAVYLRNVRYLILDEADRMLDMGFEPQIRRVVEEADMPSDRQVLLFSATFPSEIQLLAHDFLNNFIFVSIGRIGSTTDNIIQEILYVPGGQKKSRLTDIIRNDKNIKRPVEGETPYLTLIFIKTKRMADEVARHLYDTVRIPVAAIHGDIAQRDREGSLAKFKKGLVPILVATDVAQRGLDIGGVAHVINYDMPDTIDDYVHRIGRTGRAGNTGRATSFYNETCAINTSQLIEVIQEAGQEVPSFLRGGGGGGGGFGSGRGGGGGGRGGGGGGRGGGGAQPANVYGAW